VIGSIRWRLTLWYTGVLAVLLVLLCGAVYTLLGSTLWGELDSRVSFGLAEISTSLPHELSERVGKAVGEEYFQGVLSTDLQTTLPAQIVLVYDGDRLVVSKPSVGYRGNLAAVLKNPQKRPLVAPLFWSENNWRAVSSEVRVPESDTTYRIVVAESEQPVLDELARLRRAFFLLVPIGVLLVAVSGYLLARKSLAPVVQMSNAVEQITSRSLERRIPLGNQRDELGKLAATFNDLLERLQWSFEQQRRFMADASHELRTPLSISHTTAQVTLEKQNRHESEYREALTIIDKQMLRLTRLVEDMFLLARADAGGVPLRVTSLYLDEVSREALRAAQVLGNRKGVRVFAGQLPEAAFSGDEALIRQLVLILLDNAVKYTPEGGTVELTMANRPDAFEILVSDTGAGIPADVQPRLFERFFRVDSSRSRSGNGGGGAGLGLSIAHWIAEAHHGEVLLQSSSDHGSVFAIVLPKPHPEPARNGKLRII